MFRLQRAESAAFGEKLVNAYSTLVLNVRSFELVGIGVKCPFRTHPARMGN